MTQEGGNGHKNHALVFGASGLIGWSCVNQLLASYPERGVFDSVTALTNRPIKAEESFWPTAPDVPRLKLISGIDLTKGNGEGVELAGNLRAEKLENVTHVFYFVFTSLDDHIEEVAINKRMLQNVLGALSILRAPLKFVVFPGGTRGYGIYRPGGTFTPPLKEVMVDSLPPDYAKTVVYPVFRKLLDEASEGKAWTWCEICPDVITGFTPNGSQFSLALHWAQYLSLYAHDHSPGSQVPFPGIEAVYNAKMTAVSASTLARFAIYASVNPERCGGGQLFNVGDRAEPTTFGYIWPRLAEWFGLEGSGPPSGQVTGDMIMPGAYIAEHGQAFRAKGLERAEKAGVSAGSSQLDSIGTWLAFDRQLSLDRLRGSGFQEERDPVEGWIEAFEGFRKAGLIF
ncbi:hypothetical protein SUNI508_01789 [Seiridium unicorne]|uniref:PRISE-like Rossmann-fold domain-containing protein n=1 Tax=Seiridium unicorne TaxID=138068 RepID=A0ABR2UP16_9PEZI